MNKRQKNKILRRKQEIEQMVTMAETMETATGLLVKATEAIQKNIKECIESVKVTLNTFLEEVRTMPDERFAEIIQDERLDDEQRAMLRIIRSGKEAGWEK